MGLWMASYITASLPISLDFSLDELAQDVDQVESLIN